MTPSTVPSSPISGLAEPMIARPGIERPSWSRSAFDSASSTRRSASTCDPLSGGRASPPSSRGRAACPAGTGSPAPEQRVYGLGLTRFESDERPARVARPCSNSPQKDAAGPVDAAELEPFRQHDAPAHQREEGEQHEHALRDVAGALDELDRCAWNRGAGLRREHHARGGLWDRAEWISRVLRTSVGACAVPGRA